MGAANRTAIVTLVQRTTRYTLLGHPAALPPCVGSASASATQPVVTYLLKMGQVDASRMYSAQSATLSL
jgi:uncharacterized protein (DUF2062 family)